MTREEKANLLNELLEYEENNDIGNLTRAERREFQQWISKALEQEPTPKEALVVEDCISRQAVIDGIKEYFHDEYYQRTSIQDCRDCFIEDVLNHLPSVTPQEPKTGHWIDNKCTNCGYEVQPWNTTNYCPNCGSDNREVKE